METKLCPFCAEEIKAAAIKCKHCGAELSESAVAPTPDQPHSPQAPEVPVTRQGTLWLPVPSLILGIFSLLAFFDDSPWDLDTVLGIMLFSGTGLVLGIIGTATQTKGRGMSISGIVLCSIVLLASIGVLVEL